MTSLSEFLLARIAEDEAATRGFDLPNGTPGKGWIYGRDVDNDREADVAAFEGPGGPADPTRVLAECEAKRQIVARHESGGGGGWCLGCYELGGEGLNPDSLGWPCETLRVIALPYVDHPDYDQEWKP